MTPTLTERLKDLLAKATPGPWAYRPEMYDDWGFIRGPEVEMPYGPGYPIVAMSREGYMPNAHAGHDEHRRNGTDPYRPNGELIVEAVNAIPALIEALEAEKSRAAILAAELRDCRENFSNYVASQRRAGE